MERRDRAYRNWAIRAALLFLGIGIGFAARPVREFVAMANEASAVAALSRHLETELTSYFDREGTYPITIDEVGLQFADLDGASESTMRWIKYSSNGKSFALVSLGPGPFVRKLTVCAELDCYRLGLGNSEQN